MHQGLTELYRTDSTVSAEMQSPTVPKGVLIRAAAVASGLHLAHCMAVTTLICLLANLSG